MEKLDLTSAQKTQLKDTLGALRSQVMKMLSDAATYQKVDACTIVIQTGLIQTQIDEVEKLLNRELLDIIGADKLELLSDVSNRSIQDYISLLGSSDRQYTVILKDIDDVFSGEKTEQQLTDREAFSVKTRYNLSDGEVHMFQEDNHHVLSKDSLVEELGKMGAVAIKMMNEADN